jgi:enoyl-CoA hydratase
MISAFGPSRAKRILMLADTLDASEALACGFLAEIAEAESLISLSDCPFGLYRPPCFY